MKTTDPEGLWDSATFESNIVGDDRPFNAIDLTPYAYPSINGSAVDCRRVNGVDVVEITHLVDAINRESEYRLMTDWETSQVEALEYDPYRDSVYAQSLLDIFAPQKDEEY